MIFHGICPVCGSRELYKSHYRHIERLVNFVLARPVRCGSCYHRAFAFLGVKVRPRRKLGYGKPEPEVRPAASA